jgi:hypothetical protein
MIKSTEEPCVKFAKLLALLHYHMANEMIEQLGEERGTAAVLAAIRKFGQARVENMQAEARERGLDPDAYETYKIVREMPATGWVTDPQNPAVITHCPMAEIWDEYGDAGHKLGYLYCSIDHVLLDAFGMKLDRPMCKGRGDAICDFCIKPR